MSCQNRIPQRNLGSSESTKNTRSEIVLFTVRHHRLSSRPKRTKSARGVVQISLGHEIIITFAGPRRRGHVARAGCLLRGASRTWSRLAVILGRRRWRASGSSLSALSRLAALAATETILHFAETGFEVGQFLVGLADNFASRWRWMLAGVVCLGGCWRGHI